MGALVLSQILSPKGILIGIITLIVGYLIYSGIHFEKNYVALEKANTTLQMNLVTVQDALAQEKKTALTQQQIDQDTLDSVRQVTAQKLDLTTQLQDDTTALSALRTPTNEDFQCVNSPYVSTILNRMRNRSASPTNSGSTSASNAAPANGANNTSTPTSDTAK